ncbi:hypothetical protein [Fimbriiglobus ruber]|uniref:Uncharacterized protein n=1 Tax=Fimbriiglobus ruber TaxID=1908690 RepID=A0A225E8J1_9BACT|nr:hypothetical protein [Fimbriiglobus ruber]OWK45809.1 hypothetical protein FRUB_02140 [Fimbriiglobus ruber]
MTKLTPEVRRIIIDGIAAGVPKKYAAMRAGIHSRTLQVWLQRGAKATSGAHHDFLVAVRKALADALARNVAHIQMAAADKWQAAAWWLERQYPLEFATHSEKYDDIIRRIRDLERHDREVARGENPEASVEGHAHGIGTDPGRTGRALPGGGPFLRPLHE